MPKNETQTPAPTTPWWVTALIAAVAAMTVGALALYLPPSRATLLLVLGAVVFVYVLAHNPAYWRRRLAGTCIGTAAALAALPELTGFLDLGSLGFLLVDGGSALVLAALFFAGGVVIVALDVLAGRPAPGPRLLTARRDLVLGDKCETHNHGDVVIHTVDADAVMATARRHGVNLDDYLTTLLAEVDHIDIRGISTSAREAMREPIENLYTPLRSRDPRVEVDGARGEAARPRDEREEERRVLLPELLRRHDRLLLVGKAGAGKTTFIHLVTCMLARDIREPRPSGDVPWREEHLGLPRTAAAPLPALIRLRELVHDLRGRDPEGVEPSDRLWLLRVLAVKTRPADVTGDRGQDERQQQWDRWLAEGEAMLLLDGLDEVADLDLRDRVLAIVRSACASWPRCRVVVTSRPILTEAMTAAPLRFHRAEVDDFGPEEVQRFVAQWSAALFARAPGRSAENTRSLVAAIGGRPELQELARSPVMLTCLCVIHYNDEGELPSGRARVYRAIVRWLLRSREPQRRERHAGVDPKDPKQRERRDRNADGLAELAVERLALSMMEGPARRPGKVAAIDFGDAAVAIVDLVQRYCDDEREPQRRAERWLRDECELSALIEEVAGNQIKFWHLTIQEFLAAWAIARRGDWWREIEGRLGNSQWDEVVELFSGCAFEAGGQDRVDELVEKILARGEGKGLAAEAEALADVGRVLAPMRAYPYREDPALVEKQRAIAARVMAAIVTVEGARQVPVKIRIAVAEVIGAWGLDRRFDEGVDNFIPVPGTTLRMGRYPVTVTEYRRFMEAGGYGERRWWDEEGGAFRARYHQTEPWGWDDQQERPTRPVVGVAWHEARAYCRWLGEVRGELVRLPTATEWERAATWAEGEYPWGKQAATDADPTGLEPEDEVIAEELANFDEKVGAPTPVGIYPAGAGPQGHVDLAGNVWEWCDDGPPGDENRRWFKGGSWNHNRGALAAASRFWSWPDNVGPGDLGFRVVVARRSAAASAAGSPASASRRPG